MTTQYHVPGSIAAVTVEAVASIVLQGTSEVSRLLSHCVKTAKQGQLMIRSVFGELGIAAQCVMSRCALTEVPVLDSCNDQKQAGSEHIFRQS